MFKLFRPFSPLTPLLKSDHNLSMLKALRLILSDHLYRSSGLPVFHNLNALCNHYLDSNVSHSVSKKLLVDILDFNNPLVSLKYFFNSANLLHPYHSLVIAYQFGDVLAANHFDWENFLSNLPLSCQSSDLSCYLFDRYVFTGLKFIDHPFYPLPSSIDRLRNLRFNLIFSPYFTISFGHLAEVLAATALYNHLRDCSVHSTVPTIFIHQYFSVNNFVVQALADSGLIKLIALDSTTYDEALFQVFDLSLEFLNIALLRKFATMYNLSNDTKALHASSIPLDSDIGKKLSAQLLRLWIQKTSISNFSSRKPIDTLVHARSHHYKHQPHMSYRCSEPNLLHTALQSSSISHKTYPDNSNMYSLNRHRARFPESVESNAESLQLCSLLRSGHFIGTNSGPGHLSPILGVPTLLINATSLASCPIFNNICLISLKRIVRLEPSAFNYSLHRFLASLFADWGSPFSDLSTSIRQLSSFEISLEIGDFLSFKEVIGSLKWPYTLFNLLSTFTPRSPCYGDIYITKSTYEHISLILSHFTNDLDDFPNSSVFISH